MHWKRLCQVLRDEKSDTTTHRSSRDPEANASSLHRSQIDLDDRRNVRLNNVKPGWTTSALITLLIKASGAFFLTFVLPFRAVLQQIRRHPARPAAPDQQPVSRSAGIAYAAQRRRSGHWASVGLPQGQCPRSVRRVAETVYTSMPQGWRSPSGRHGESVASYVAANPTREAWGKASGMKIHRNRLMVAASLPDERVAVG